MKLEIAPGQGPFSQKEHVRTPAIDPGLAYFGAVTLRADSATPW